MGERKMARKLRRQKKNERRNLYGLFAATGAVPVRAEEKMIIEIGQKILLPSSDLHCVSHTALKK